MGIVFAAVYALALMQRAFQGPLNPAVSAMRDFGPREVSTMGAMAAGLLWLGVYPQPVLDMAAGTLATLAGGMP